MTTSKATKTGLRATALAVLMIPLAALAASNQHSNSKQFLIGLELYTVRDDCAKDLPGVLKAVAGMGYSGVEFAGYYGRTAQELRQMLDDDHLKCYGSHITLDALRGDNFDKTVEYTKILGNKLLVIPWIPKEERETRTSILHAAALFSDLAKRLEKHGIMLAYHNHSDEFRPVDGELFWNTFFGNTDRRVAIQFDIGNALEAGVQAATYLTKYPGRVVSVHVKDFSPTKPQALLGEGDEHWNEVIPILKGKNGPRWFIIEQETYPYPPLECAEKCLRNFEKMMGIR